MELICHPSPGASSEQIHQNIRYIDDQLFKTQPANNTEHAFPRSVFSETRQDGNSRWLFMNLGGQDIAQQSQRKYGYWSQADSGFNPPIC